MRHTLEKADVYFRAWDNWVVGDRTARTGTDPDAAETFAAVLVAARWCELGKQRSELHGLGDGRNEEVIHLVNRAYRSAVANGMLWVIQSDSVFTPARTHLQRGYDASCPLCGTAMGSWQNYIDDCTGTQWPPEQDCTAGTSIQRQRTSALGRTN